MANELQGKTIAILVGEGVEQVELTEPRKAVEEAGAQVHLVSLSTEPFRGFDELDPSGDTFTPDRAVSDASASDYDGLILPGGVANGDFVRADGEAVRFVREFFEAGKPVSAICHGLWVLAEADVVRGLTMTSWPSLQTDLRNAGATWVDEEVVVDQGLTTSRHPGDLPAFCAKTVEEFAEGPHEELAAVATGDQETTSG